MFSQGLASDHVYCNTWLFLEPSDAYAAVFHKTDFILITKDW